MTPGHVMTIQTPAVACSAAGALHNASVRRMHLGLDAMPSITASKLCCTWHTLACSLPPKFRPSPPCTHVQQILSVIAGSCPSHQNLEPTVQKRPLATRSTRPNRSHFASCNQPSCVQCVLNSCSEAVRAAFKLDTCLQGPREAALVALTQICAHSRQEVRMVLQRAHGQPPGCGLSWRLQMHTGTQLQLQMFSGKRGG